MIQDRIYKWIIGSATILVGALWYVWQEAPLEPAGKVVTLCNVVDKKGSTKRFSAFTVQSSNIHPAAEYSPIISTLTDPFLQHLAGGLKTVEAVSDLMEREEELQVLADSVAVSDMPAALKYLQAKSQSESGRNLEVLLIRKWAEDDVHAASIWVDKMPAGAARMAAINGVAIVWANKELVEAIQWVSQLPEDEERQNALKSVAYEAARTEPEESLRLAMEQPVQPDWNELIRFASMQWAAKDPEGASEWAEQITDIPLRDQILGNITTVWGDTDPRAAATKALLSISLGREQDDAVVGIIQRWVQKEPEMAAAWVEQFPESEVKRTALENVVKLWADKDAQKVGAWLNSLSNGSMRDTAIAAFAGRLAP